MKLKLISLPSAANGIECISVVDWLNLLRWITHRLDLNVNENELKLEWSCRHCAHHIHSRQNQDCCNNRSIMFVQRRRKVLSQSHKSRREMSEKLKSWKFMIHKKSTRLVRGENWDVEQVTRACEFWWENWFRNGNETRRNFVVFFYFFTQPVDLAATRQDVLRMFQLFVLFSQTFKDCSVLSLNTIPHFSLLTLIFNEFVLPNCVVLATIVVGLTVARVVCVAAPPIVVVIDVDWVTRFLFLFVWVCRTGFLDALGVADCFREPCVAAGTFLVVDEVDTSRRCRVLSKFWAFSLAKSRANTSRTIRFTTSSSHKFGSKSDSGSLISSRCCDWNFSRCCFELVICSLFANVDSSTTKHRNFTKEFFIIS